MNVVSPKSSLFVFKYTLHTNILSFYSFFSFPNFPKTLAHTKSSFLIFPPFIGFAYSLYLSVRLLTEGTHDPLRAAAHLGLHAYVLALRVACQSAGQRC